MDDFQFLHDSFETEDNLKFHADVPNIVLVEDDQVFALTVKKFLEKKLNNKVFYYSNPNDCLNSLEDFAGSRFCLITDISFDNASIDGLYLLDLLKEKGQYFVSIAMTGFASIENAITATKKGVFHYLTKPFELDVLLDLVVKAMTSKLGVSREFIVSSDKSHETTPIQKKLKIEAPTEQDIFCGMIGRSKKMKDVFERIKKVSESDSTVLITGPSGTGKELVANAIHVLSPRADMRKVSVNCGAIPGDLLESELFGHVRGSFTGAISDRKGRFELANKGTIFLDEIGDMPLHLQVKLLRVLQLRQIEPVGSTETTHVDVRIITATHKDLDRAVNDGQFREDLFYRLNVIPIKIPSLSERREDIPLLISYFLSRFVSADGRNQIEFDDEALELLYSYDWPGNVRELENLIERIVILKGGSFVRANDLPSKFFQNRPAGFTREDIVALPDDGVDLKNILSEIEDSLILQALELTGGNKNQASKLLKMNRTTLIEKMKKKGLMYV